MRFPGVLSVLLVLTCNLWAQKNTLLQIRIVDIWSGQPIPSAVLFLPDDTLHASADGLISLSSQCIGNTVLRIQAPNYFREQIRCSALKNKIVYLTPLDQTPFITVVRSKTADLPLNLPTHRTHLNVKSLPEAAMLSLNELLQGSSGVFVKSYGPPGTLQTISVRGMSSEQSQILFDGIPLNNLQLGSADLSAFPLNDLSGIDLYRGSNIILGGSGAIGGSLNLLPGQPAHHFKMQVRAAYSSLKNKFAEMRIHLPLPHVRMRSLLTFGHANGLNRYDTHYNGKNTVLRDRDFRQNHLSFQMIFEPKNFGQFKFFVNHFKRHAGAPRAFVNPLSERENRARLALDNTLVYARWQREQKRLGYYAQIYARNEWMTYFDPGLRINFKSLHSIHFNKEQGLQVRFHYSPRQPLLLKSGVEMARQTVISSEAGKHKRQRQAFYVLSDWKLYENSGTLQAFHLNGGLRVERYSARESVFLPALGASFTYRRFQIYANTGKNFRIPSFNDLYWKPGGNPNLKPEFSKNFEIGLRQMWPFLQWLGQLEISAYQNEVKDQIRWLPGKAGYWTPRNISKVRSRGVEIDLQWASVDERHKLRFSYGCGQAVKKAPEVPDDRTVGNQLPFLPQEQWALNARTAWKQWQAGFSLRRTGFRYSDFSNDPNAILPSFTIVNLWMQGTLTFGKWRLIPGVALENAFDRSYEVLKGFPMPGRFVRLSCSVHWDGAP